MFERILVVCTANICRSPIGEALLQHYLPNKKVASAGVAVTKSRMDNHGADASAAEIAAEHGLDVSHHQATQITPEMLNQFDLVLVMESRHIKSIAEIAPQAQGKTMLFSKWTTNTDVPDPYRQSKEAFTHVHQLLDSSAQQWAKKLK